MPLLRGYTRCTPPAYRVSLWDGVVPSTSHHSVHTSYEGEESTKNIKNVFFVLVPPSHAVGVGMRGESKNIKNVFFVLAAPHTHLRYAYGSEHPMGAVPAPRVYPSTPAAYRVSLWDGVQRLRAALSLSLFVLCKLSNYIIT